MEKVYQSKNVYEAFVDRMDFIFSEFENIIISFSGGKDSGLLYNLIMKYMADRGITRPIALFHQDFEAQYQATTDYVERTFEQAPPFVYRVWGCVPMAVRNSTSTENPWWYPWDPDKQDLWVRPMPQFPYVVSLDNPPDYYEYKMPEKDYAQRLGRWYKNKMGGGKTISLLGLRAVESLQRYSAIVNKKYDYNGKKWITESHKGVWTASPLYDWETDDVWTANAKFNFDYNKLYDLYYKAGVPFADMRVASPFLEFGSKSLSLYRVIEPDTWVRLLGRVEGVNFGSIYGGTKAMGYKEITLPKGHTWKSYLRFLLDTLPPNIRAHYEEKFAFSKQFWAETGGGLQSDVIAEIETNGYSIKRNGASPYCKDKKERIVFEGEIPDNTDDVSSTGDIPSYKRCCFCILKNDYCCRFMGFGPTKDQQQRIKTIKAKYASIIKGGTGRAI